MEMSDFYLGVAVGMFVGLFLGMIFFAMLHIGAIRDAEVDRQIEKQ
jgi:hypothetical protein